MIGVHFDAKKLLICIYSLDFQCYIQIDSKDHCGKFKQRPAASIHVQADNDVCDKEELAMRIIEWSPRVAAVNSNLNNDAGNTLGGEKCPKFKEVSSCNDMKPR